MTPTDRLVHAAYRAPYDWPRMLRFLHTRSVKGVESVRGDSYLRTVQLGEHTGWICVRDDPKQHALLIDVTPSLDPVRSELLTRLHHLFDLSARPDVIAAHFANDALLADAVARRPGLRVPGAFDGFELAVRAVLGQQITVKAASTIAGRFAAAFGGTIDTPHAELTHLSPTASRVAALSIPEIASLGIIQTRARSIIAVAEEMASGRLKLEPGAHPDAVIEQLIALPGIGPWTAHYIAMRALRWSDAFPRGDIALRNALGRVSAARAEELSQPWRPWRSYATLHLWFESGESQA
jgi:AraC family transcriptional regulator, regulatory protein of adaptative response / DNA-3-methyladenine glycosylase II